MQSYIYHLSKDRRHSFCNCNSCVAANAFVTRWESQPRTGSPYWQILCTKHNMKQFCGKSMMWKKKVINMLSMIWVHDVAMFRPAWNTAITAMVWESLIPPSAEARLPSSPMRFKSWGRVSINREWNWLTEVSKHGSWAMFFQRSWAKPAYGQWPALVRLAESAYVENVHRTLLNMDFSSANIDLNHFVQLQYSSLFRSGITLEPGPLTALVRSLSVRRIQGSEIESIPNSE